MTSMRFAPDWTDKAVVPAFQDVLDVSSRFLMLMGGAGSGKSHFAAQKVILKNLCIPHYSQAVFRKTRRTMRESTFRDLWRTICDMGLARFYRKNLTELSIENQVNGNRIISAGLDDAEKIKSMSEIAGAWVEEATELSEKDFDQINLRVRAPGPNEIITSFNPVSARHWLKRRFFDRVNPPARRVITTYRDNPYLPTDYKAELEAYAETHPEWYRIYGCGEWGVAHEGLIFTPERHWRITYTLLEPDYYDEIIYGLDFGWNAPSALVELRIRDRKEVTLVERLYQPGLTNDDLARRMRKAILDPRYRIYADSAQPDRIETLRRSGFNIYEGRKDVLDGIDHLLSQDLYVYDSPNIVEELSEYRWQTNAMDEPIDMPYKDMDHAVDATRYASYTHLVGRGIMTMGKLSGVN